MWEETGRGLEYLLEGEAGEQIAVWQGVSATEMTRSGKGTYRKGFTKGVVFAICRGRRWAEIAEFWRKIE